MASTDQIALLVRAFNAAWDAYSQPSRNGCVSKSVARPLLSEFLVRKLREGIDDESGLAAAGLEFLFTLEDKHDEPIDPPSWSLHLENAGARFVPMGRIQVAKR